MSATNRGTVRNEADYYPTPAWVTQRLLQHVDLPGGEWLEPSAGEGHIVRAVNVALHVGQTEQPRVRWTVAELREECGPPLRSMGLAPVFGDFLAMRWPERFAVCIQNPPFQFAQEFIEHALTVADQTVALLRLSFLESQKREHFFAKVGVPDVFVLPERPSFTGEGTDACAYAWMRWRHGATQEGRVRILYDKRQLSLLGGA